MKLPRAGQEWMRRRGRQLHGINDKKRLHDEVRPIDFRQTEPQGWYSIANLIERSKATPTSETTKELTCS